MLEIRPVTDGDRAWVVEFLELVWGSVWAAAHGELMDCSRHPGFLARLDGERSGLLTYRIEGGDCEVTSLASLREGRGAGRALLDAARDRAVAAGCDRLWLITTNDNTRALRVYQRWGMDLVALHRHALRQSRRLKPSIPELGNDGIPLDHELELELRLQPRSSPHGVRASGSLTAQDG
ncbi:MAG TPA: GNAT family N-acetyltransferase [Actinomycetes bacterium]|nr:GNAT family N-acetyltransferase [Actinomycetes bacterium]